MHVTRLFRYPIKSFPGIEVDSLAFDDFGPVGDRRWMLVDTEGRFQTQRLLPQLAMARVTEGDEGLTLTLPEGASARLIANRHKREVRVWRDQVAAVSDNGDASSLISAWLKKDLQFVYMPEDSFRQIDTDYVPQARRVSFADGFPLLVVNEASVDQVSTWVGRTMDVRRFRPGIVIGGVGRAFAEDLWRGLAIGELGLDLVKPCGRCVMTTVDPDKGLKEADGEPLATLKRYRPGPEGPIFGQNALHQGAGQIRVGDPVQVTAVAAGGEAT